jgi:magnesium chelatase family protein
MAKIGRNPLLASIASEALSGLEGKPVQVEADVVAAAPAFSIVGLPDAAVKESRDRVSTAMSNSGYKVPMGRTTINLAPADVRKDGTGFDLPIALATMAADGIFKAEELARLERYLVVGELSLDGPLRPVRGILPMASAARDRGFAGLIVAAENAVEAALVDRIESTKDLTADDEKALADAIEDFKKNGAY